MADPLITWWEDHNLAAASAEKMDPKREALRLARSLRRFAAEADQHLTPWMLEELVELAMDLEVVADGGGQ